MADAKVEVKLVADTQKFEQDMARATQSVKRSSEDIKQSFRSIKEVAGALGIGLGLTAAVSAFEEIARKTIEEERAINQLNAALLTTGRSAGITAKALKEISESIQKGSVFDDDSIRKATTALLAFRSVQGETFKEILRLAPDVATRLGKDLPEATQLLARAVQSPGEGLRVLKAAGVEVSEQQIDLADRLKQTGHAAESAQVMIDAVTRSFGGAAQSDTTGLYGATRRAARSWDDLVKALGRKLLQDNAEGINQAAEGFDRLAKAIDGSNTKLQDMAALTASPLMSSAIIKLRDWWKTRGEEAVAGRSAGGPIRGLQEAEEAWAKQAAVDEKARQDADRAYELEKIRLRKRAENAAAFHTEELQATQRSLALQQSAYEFAYSQNEITIDEFYEHSKDSAQKSAEATKKFIQQQQQELENFVFSDKFNPKDEEVFLQKLQATQAQTTQASAANAARQQEIDQKRKLAIKQLGLAYDELAITVAEAEGRIGDAAAASFEKSTREQRKQFQAIADRGGPDAGKAAQAVSQYDALTRRAKTLGDLSEAEQDFGRTLQQVSNLQESVDLKAQTGTLTTLEAMKEKEDLARRFLPVLQAEAAAYETRAAALAAGDPEREKAILQAQRLRLEIEKLGVASQATGKMFTDIFTNAFADGFAEIITGTKSVKDAFKDMERSIVQAISRIAAQNIAESIFGKSGAGSGIGPFLASLFAGADTGIGFPTAGFASGTNFAPGGMALVGERGPEIVNLPRGAQVIPFDRAQYDRATRAENSIAISQQINVLPGASRASAMQAAAAAAREARVAAIRNG